MMLLTSVLAAVSFACIVEVGSVTLSKSPPANSSAPLLEGFVSYSIEFSSFPDFAGMPRSPSNEPSLTGLFRK